LGVGNKQRAKDGGTTTMHTVRTRGGGLDWDGAKLAGGRLHAIYSAG
jgi:hypothetical protein